MTYCYDDDNDMSLIFNEGWGKYEIHQDGKNMNKNTIKNVN